MKARQSIFHWSVDNEFPELDEALAVLSHGRASRRDIPIICIKFREIYHKASQSEVEGRGSGGMP